MGYVSDFAVVETYRDGEFFPYFEALGSSADSEGSPDEAVILIFFVLREGDLFTVVAILLVSPCEVYEVGVFLVEDVAVGAPDPIVALPEGEVIDGEGFG